jgi:hypothetical protein
MLSVVVVFEMTRKFWLATVERKHLNWGRTVNTKQFEEVIHKGVEHIYRRDNAEYLSQGGGGQWNDAPS